MLKSNNLYVSNENGLKLKIKLPTSTNSTPSANFVSNSLATISSNISNNFSDDPSISKVKKKKEVLNYGNMNSIDSIKLENEEKLDIVEPERKERIIMKLKTKPIAPAEPEASQPLSGHSQSNESPHAPIKLKLKISAIDSSVKAVTYINPSHSQPNDSKIDNEDFMRKTDRDEDDEMISELKNSYIEGDFVYPCLKKEPNAKRKDTSMLPNEEESSECKKSSRKRKLKPHAVQYLMPKEAEPTKDSQSPVKDANQVIAKIFRNIIS